MKFAYIKSALIYISKVWLKTLLISLVFTGIAVRSINATNDDLPVPVLCLLLLVLQLLCSVLPGVLCSWLFVPIMQRTNSVSKKKGALWLVAVIMMTVVVGGYILLAGWSRVPFSTLINGVDDLITLTFLGNTLGLALMIWLHDLPELPDTQTTSQNKLD